MKIVVIKLGSNLYGLDIMRIDEVINYIKPLDVPKMPIFIEGVIDFRKSIVPLVDFRKRFEIKKVVNTPDTRIIILKNEDNKIGIIVDEATEVVKYETDDLLPNPKKIIHIKNKFVQGFLRKDERSIILLNIDRILSTDESLLLQKFKKNLKKDKVDGTRRKS